MAKKSKIVKNERRRAIVARYAQRRAELKEIIRSPSSTGERRAAAQSELARQPRDASAVRLRNRDAVDEEAQLRVGRRKSRRQLKLLRCQADCAADVLEAAFEEMPRLVQCRHGDSAVARVDRKSRRLDRFQSLHVRSQTGAQRMDVFQHLITVIAQLVNFD